MNKTLENIRFERIKKGYTQDYMAIQLGIEQRTYSKLENGHIKLSVQRLKRIAKILQVKPSLFLD